MTNTVIARPDTVVIATPARVIALLASSTMRPVLLVDASFTVI
jgi:hypothetical protein